jgi:hypothetical protein
MWMVMVENNDLGYVPFDIDMMTNFAPLPLQLSMPLLPFSFPSLPLLPFSFPSPEGLIVLRRW